MHSSRAMGRDSRFHRSTMPLAFALSIGMAGCSDGSSVADPAGPDAAVITADCDSLSGTASVTIGGGSDSEGFVAINDGDDLVGRVLQAGLWGFTPSLCMDNMWPGEAGRDRDNPNDPEVLFRMLLVADNSEIGGSAIERRGFTEKTGCDELHVIYLPFFVATDVHPGDIYGNQEVRLEVTVEDACNRTATDELTVVVRRQ